jgi:opacity protein-like surface antigen
MSSILSRYTTFIGALVTIIAPLGQAAGAEVDLKSLQPLEAKKKATHGAYVGVFAGQTISQSASMQLDYVDHSLDYTMDDRDGDLIVGFEIGYAWRTRYPIELGLEFEAFYGSTEANGVVSNDNADVAINLSDVATAQTDMSYVAFMLNGTLTLDLRRYRPQLGRFLPRLRPYAGVGIGGAQIWYRNQRVQSFGDLLGTASAPSSSPFSVDEFVFAWQIFAGMEYRVTDKLGLYTEFRRLTFEKVSDLDDFKTDMIVGGLRWKY